MLPELNGLGLRDQEKRQPSEGHSQLVPPECFPPEVLPVHPPWMAQAPGCLPSALPWQVSAENSQLIISTNNSGQAKHSLGPDLLLRWDFMSEDVKMGKKNKKALIWKRAGKASHHCGYPWV